MGSQVFLAVSACPTLQAVLAPVGSPLFTYTPLHACCGYAPRKHSPASRLRLWWFCLPRRGRRVGCFTLVRFRGYFSHSLVFRPTCSLSTLRRARYRTRRKTRYLTARYALSGSPLQTAGLYALARRNPQTEPGVRISRTGLPPWVNGEQSGQLANHAGYGVLVTRSAARTPAVSPASIAPFGSVSAACGTRFRSPPAESSQAPGSWSGRRSTGSGR